MTITSKVLVAWPRWCWPLLLAVGTFALYFAGIAQAPIYVVHDEVNFALHAEAIARTGRDLNGRLLPLYFEIPGAFWATPVCIYMASAVMTIVPLSEATVRLPSVLVATLNVVLIYFVGQKLFARRVLAMMAAVLLALTPLHFIHGRMLVDNIYPVPFVLTGLLGLYIFLDDSRKTWALAAGCLALGVGFYSYHASVVTMPLCFGLILCALWIHGVRSHGRYVAATVGFVLPLLPLAVWLLAYPQHFAEHSLTFKVYDPRLNPLQGLRELMSHTSLTARSDVYWSYFNPSLLFLSGDSSVLNSTRQAGVFLWPLAALLGSGVIATILRDRTPRLWTLVGLMLIAPVPAALVAEYSRAARMVPIVPAAILLSVAGWHWLWSSRRPAARALAAACLIAVPLVFTGFHRDYMGPYGQRYSTWFEGNIRGALEEAIRLNDQQRAPRVWLDASVPFIASFWRFHLLKHGLSTLLDGAIVDDGSSTMPPAPPGSIVVARARGTLDTRLARDTDFAKQADVTEPDGRISFVVFRRTRQSP